MDKPDKKPEEQVDAFDNLDKLAQEIEDENKAVEGEVETENDRKSKASAEDEAARAGAAMAVGFAEAMVKMKWSFVQIPAEQRAQVIDKATPVVKKYGTSLPPWLLPYQDEIELGMVLAVAGFGIYAQVQAHKAAEDQAKQEVRDAVSAEEPQHRAPEPA